MIRPNKKIGIVYCANSNKYANELVSIINEYGKNGYCIEPIKIDDKLIDSETDIEKRVFENLKKCSFAFVFLTKDLLIQDTSTFTSKPNVILELGFFMGHLDNNNNIWCIIDFPYDDIKSGKYMVISDIPSKYYHFINATDSFFGIKTIFDNFIKVQKQSISQMKNYNANDLVTSLVLNSSYKTDYRKIFTIEQLSVIKKFSLEHQLEECLNIWTNEKSLLSEIQEIVYLYERIIFIPFFKDDNIIRKIINDFLFVDLEINNAYISACYNILRNIIDYEEYKRHRYQIEIYEFYLDIAKKITTNLNILNSCQMAPIIECVSKNYLGLTYLNAYFVSKKQGCGCIDYLTKAKEYFLDVIEISQNNLGDSLNVFKSFSIYNLARVKSNLGENARTEYTQAIEARDNLSNFDGFPQIFKLNFSLEKILADSNFYAYLFEESQITKEEYVSKIKILREELSRIKTISMADVSLFKTLENNFISTINNLM